MKPALLSLLCASFLLLIPTGCIGIRLPIYPTAVLYPTIQPQSQLSLMDPLPQCSEENIRQMLLDMGILSSLSEKQFPEFVLQQLVLGLQTKGYAELDLRRCGTPMHWVCFQNRADGIFEMRTGFRKKPAEAFLHGIKPIPDDSRIIYLPATGNLLRSAEEWRNSPYFLRQVMPLSASGSPIWETGFRCPSAQLPAAATP